MVLNSRTPLAAETQMLRKKLEERYSVPVMALNAMEMEHEDILSVFEQVLFQFPLREIRISVPEWLDALDNVVFENYNYIRKKLSTYFEMSVMEGSYLLFLKIGRYSTDYSAAKCLIEKCHILANPGEDFAKEYNGWVRLNLATSMNNIKKAVKALMKLVEDSDR